MDDLIRRQDAIDAFSDVLDSDFPYVSEETPRERIKSIPSAEPRNKDAISREGLLKSWEELSLRGRTEFDQVIMTIPALPSAEPKTGMLTEEVREALMRLTMCAREECQVCKYEDDCRFDKRYQRATKNMNIISDALSEPKTGTWKEEYAGNGWNDFWDYTCSECGREFHRFYKSNFCPNCGADMRGEEE